MRRNCASSSAFSADVQLTPFLGFISSGMTPRITINSATTRRISRRWAESACCHQRGSGGAAPSTSATVNSISRANPESLASYARQKTHAWPNAKPSVAAPRRRQPPQQQWRPDDALTSRRLEAQCHPAPKRFPAVPFVRPRRGAVPQCAL